MKSLGPHLLLALLAVAIFAIMHRTVGRIELRNGEGWDGIDYAVMLREGWITGRSTRDGTNPSGSVSRCRSSYSQRGVNIWRYLMALAPMALVFYARSSREWSQRDAVVWSTAAMALTVWTQQPFARMDVARYFADWFPNYAWTNNMPDGIVANPLWPDWSWRFAVVACAFGSLILYARRRPPPAAVKRT